MHSINVSGLTNGTPYTFTVTATNHIGTGPPSAASNSVAPVAAATVPAAPTIGTATAGDGQATVTFTAPANDGGSAITSYTVTSLARLHHGQLCRALHVDQCDGAGERYAVHIHRDGHQQHWHRCSLRIFEQRDAGAVVDCTGCADDRHGDRG
jgi:hypothetical protein